MPEGKYSFLPEEIGEDRCISFFSDQANIYYNERLGEDSLEMCSLKSPFSAPKCLMLTKGIPIKRMGQFALMEALRIPVELKNSSVREGIQNTLTQLWGSVSKEHQVFLKNDPKLLVGYATNDYNWYVIGIAAGKSLYIGQLWINDEEDVKEAEKQAVEWLILKEEEDRILVITKDLLMYKPVYESPNYAHYKDDPWMQRSAILSVNSGAYSWEGGTLRNWLNKEFFEAAFTNEEKERILTAKYYSETKKQKEFKPGKELEDKIFILSAGEVSELLKSKPRRKAKWSSLVKAKATALYAAYWGEGFGDWWLRTDCGEGRLAIVTEAGGIVN